MKGYIEERAITIAQYIIDRKATVRPAASRFGVSKRTSPQDMTERLPAINHTLAENVRKVLDINKSERHLRGGMATRAKYKHISEEQ